MAEDFENEELPNEVDFENEELPNEVDFENEELPNEVEEVDEDDIELDFENENNPFRVPISTPDEWNQNRFVLLQRAKNLLNLNNDSNFGNKPINALLDMGYITQEEAREHDEDRNFNIPYIMRIMFLIISDFHREERGEREVLHITSIEPDYRGQDFFNLYLKDGYCTILFWQRPNTISLVPRNPHLRTRFMLRNPDGTLTDILDSNVQGCVLIEKRRANLIVLMRNEEGRLIEMNINDFFREHINCFHYVIGIQGRTERNRNLARNVLLLNNFFSQRQPQEEGSYKPVRKTTRRRYSPYTKKRPAKAKAESKNDELPVADNRLPTYLPSDLGRNIYDFLKVREYSPKRRVKSPVKRRVKSSPKRRVKSPVKRRV